MNKATLLEKLAGMVSDKKINGINDLRDDSHQDGIKVGIRVVIELKRDVAAVVLARLISRYIRALSLYYICCRLFHSQISIHTLSLVVSRYKHKKKSSGNIILKPEGLSITSKR